MPPDAKALAIPSLPPLHVVELPVAFTESAVGSSITTEPVSEHVLSSVTVTVYVPAVRLEDVALFTPVLQA